MGRIVWMAALFLAQAGIYLFLAGTMDAVEITAAIVCATLAVALASALEIVAKRNYVPRPPLKGLLAPFAALLPEAWTVGRELLIAAAIGRSSGAFGPQPFDPGGNDPRAAARRALTVIGVSLAPRSFVVRGERTDQLLLHELPPKPASPDRRWPA